MKASEHPTYNPKYPEQFDWTALDNNKACSCACQFAAVIRAELNLQGELRGQTAGLRYALQLMAGTFDL